jgi:hypothetical protein
MSIRSKRQLAVTERKLRLLQDQYDKTKQKRVENALVRELTLQSLKRMINQLTEEIARYQAHASTEKRS